ncbi:alpha/beta-hydrolase [Aspergillus ambiguus]|uniref:alpha/beta hydrolase n=1 Tax=Aspergillus ambiguus TaxID=176160 RepID=UPI003CCDADB8
MAENFPFIVTEHVIDGQHIREYPRATLPQEAPVKLVVKKYTPKDNLRPQKGDITIIGAHGLGFLKEFYEPLWEDLLARSKQDGFRIRAIWVADCANQGASGVQNEYILGNETSWLDHSRDLLHMVNCFREDMPRPIMGIGHSAGAAQLITWLTNHRVLLSLAHPRLFASMVFLDPYITPHDGHANGLALVWITASRKDTWSSREEAEKFIRKVMRSWDPRVVDRCLRYSFRSMPTAIHPYVKREGSNSEDPVTLTTSKHQETFSTVRANFLQHKQLGLSDNEAYSEPGRVSRPHDALFLPDMLGRQYQGQMFYRPETVLAYRLLPHVRPGVLFVSGAESTLYQSGYHSEAARRTGTGFSGSGGQDYSRVKHVVIDKARHTLPMEFVTQTADSIGLWIAAEGERWWKDERRIADKWEALSITERSTIPDEWAEPLKALKPANKRDSML